MSKERRQALETLAAGRITVERAARVRDVVAQAGARGGDGAGAGERRCSPPAASDPTGRARIAQGRQERAWTK